MDRFLAELGRAITEGRVLGVSDLEPELAWLLRNRPSPEPRSSGEIAAIQDSLDDLDRAVRVVRAAVAVVIARGSGR